MGRSKCDIRAIELLLKKYSSVLFGDENAIRARDLRNAFRNTVFTERKSLSVTAAMRTVIMSVMTIVGQWISLILSVSGRIWRNVLTHYLRMMCVIRYPCNPCIYIHIFIIRKKDEGKIFNYIFYFCFCKNSCHKLQE